jgi:hypothetical protein
MGNGDTFFRGGALIFGGQHDKKLMVPSFSAVRHGDIFISSFIFRERYFKCCSSFTFLIFSGTAIGQNYF